MAGFSLSGFPSPFAGGTLATSVLANLDMLNHRRPLDAHKLSLGDTSELSTLYHRLIELAKFGVGQISRLGDPYDRSTGTSALPYGIQPFFGQTWQTWIGLSTHNASQLQRRLERKQCAQLRYV